jgi:hypothetical protein
MTKCSPLSPPPGDCQECRPRIFAAGFVRVEAIAKSPKRTYRKRQPGGIVKAEGLGDGPAPGKVAIAKLRLTMLPTMLGDFTFVLW